MLFVAGSLLVYPVEVGESVDTLRAAGVVADRGIVVSRRDTVRLGGQISITEALRAVPGMYVGDNGGAAGLKKVNLRGMGSAHTAIYIDGVRVSDLQSGQADLGMLDLGSFGAAVVDYAQNSLSFQTQRPALGANGCAGAVRYRGGAFGTHEPAVRLDLRLSDAVVMSVNASGVWSRGDFPYGKKGDGGAREDGSVAAVAGEMRRENNDVKQGRGGVDVWGMMRGGDWHAKAYVNAAERGTPGSVDWPSTDRQRDRNGFVQGVMREQFTPRYILSISTKAAVDDLNYYSTWGDSQYRQTEVQVNTAQKFGIARWLDASVAADWQWDGLESSAYEVERTTVVATATAALHAGRWQAEAGLEYAGVWDAGQAAAGGGEKRYALSPAVDLRWDAGRGLALQAFARRAYRVPTFNEMYYPGYGNPALHAEDAWLTDAGASYHRAFGRWSLDAKADVFYNYLTDKIISAPSEADPSYWLPYNVGAVQMAGSDLQASLAFCRLALTARYSLQHAVDGDGMPVPYVARHSVYTAASAQVKTWRGQLSWSWLGGRHDAYGQMPDYQTLDLTVEKSFKTFLTLKLIGSNLTDCRYELAAGYPMPGRALYAQIEIKF